MGEVSKRHTYCTDDIINGSYSPPNSVIHYKHSSRRQKQARFGPYILGSTLGEGEFGKVKLGWSRNTSKNINLVPKHVAIKLIRRDNLSQTKGQEVKVYREINALKLLSHPNIVKLEEVLQNSKYIGIVLEYSSGGEFYKYIQRKKRIKEPRACSLFAQLVSGVNYIHTKGLVHRDLKLENLLLDKHENLIITDFGFVNEFSNNSKLMKTPCGSPCYAAPELVIFDKPYDSRKADIWSCGVILYAMLAGYLPWDDDPENPESGNIVKLYNYITKHPLKFPEYISPVPRDLLRRILISDPKKRITLKNILLHEWLKAHLPFLSITSEEWDKTMSSCEVFRPSKPERHQRPHSSCSTLSTDKRDSLIIDSTLLQLPAPPKESQLHVIATRSDASINSELQMMSNSKPKGKHTRSNSAASLALQAVVDAEKDLAIHLSNSSSAKKKAFVEKNVINETSLEEHQILKDITNQVTRLHNSNKIDRKLRPTSYHPGMYNAFDSGLISYGYSSKKTSDNEITLPNDYLTNLLYDTTQTLSAASSSSTVLPLRKSSMSKPTVDFQMVTGDLSKEKKNRRESFRHSGIIVDKIFSAVTEESEYGISSYSTSKSSDIGVISGATINSGTIRTIAPYQINLSRAEIPDQRKIVNSINLNNDRSKTKKLFDFIKRRSLRI